MKLHIIALLAMTAHALNGQVPQIPPPPPPAGLAPIQAHVSPEEFVLFRYAALLSRAAFVPCQTPVGTQYVRPIAGTATGYITRDTTRNIYAIVMRGSKSFRDYKTDGDYKLTPYDVPGSQGCQGCLMHHGFQESVRGVLPGILESVKAEVAQNPNVNILVTGHSLGGATCSLIALPLRQIYGEKVTGVCLGSPRVGNAAFSDFFGRFWTPGSYFRVTSTKDGVPQQPATAAGFKHAGQEYWIKKEPATSPDDIVICNGPEDPACNAQFKTKAFFGINMAHISYIVSFLKPQCGTAADVTPPPSPAASPPVGPVISTSGGPAVGIPVAWAPYVGPPQLGPVPYSGVYPGPVTGALPSVGGPAVDVLTGLPIQGAPLAVGFPGDMSGMPLR